MASKEAIVCIIDVSKSMATVDRKGEPSRLGSAAKAVDLLVQQKMMFRKSDQVGLVLFGTEGTDNDLNEEMGGYDNVTVGYALDETSVDISRQLKELAPSEDTEGDMLDALVVALDMLHKRTGKKKVTRRIFLVTDAASRVKDADDIPRIVEQLEQLDCKLFVVGVNFKGVMAAADGEEEEEAAAGDVKAENERMLRTMVRRTGGQLVAAARAIDIMGQMRSKSVKLVTKFRGDLELGANCRLPLHCYSRTQESRLPSLTKQSEVAAEPEEGGKVVMERLYRSQANPDGEVEAEHRVRAYRYGKQLVPFSSENEASLKMLGDKRLQLIGFTDAANVPRHHFVGAVDMLVAEPGNESAQVGVSALVRALKFTTRVAIVRFVKRANSAPALGALCPSLVDGCEVLLFVPLPFMEDVRDFAFPDIKAEAAPTPAQRAAAASLIDSMDLSGLKGTGELLKPELCFNPVLQRFYATMQARALDPEAAVPKLDPMVFRYLWADRGVARRAAPAMDAFTQAFPLRPAPPKTKTKKRFWSDVMEEEGAHANGGSEAKKAKEGGGGGGDGGGPADLNVDELLSGGHRVTEVGGVDPVGDFNALLADRAQDATAKAVAGMEKQVRATLAGGSQAYYKKAVACLRALRDGCLANAEAAAFNRFLRELKADALGVEEGGEPWGRPLWKLLEGAEPTPLSLITSEEEPDVDVTAQEAAEFLLTAQAAPPAAVVAAVEDDDDLFDDME